MEYYVGYTFTYGEDYSNIAKWCNENGKVIKQVENTLDGRSQFQIQEKEPIILTDEQKLDRLRELRERECFPIINRGVLWYNTLTSEQQLELDTWYKAWLNVPQVYQETKPEDIETIIPQKPIWLT